VDYLFSQREALFPSLGYMMPWEWKNKISNRFVPKIYFSDDDKKNLEFTHKKLSNRPENIIQFISTHGGERKKYEG
jgi:hypothetical protein